MYVWERKDTVDSDITLRLNHAILTYVTSDVLVSFMHGPFIRCLAFLHVCEIKFQAIVVLDEKVGVYHARVGVWILYERMYYNVCTCVCKPLPRNTLPIMPIHTEKIIHLYH